MSAAPTITRHLIVMWRIILIVAVLGLVLGAPAVAAEETTTTTSSTSNTSSSTDTAVDPGPQPCRPNCFEA